MHYSSALKFAIVALSAQASAWSFTAFDDTECGKNNAQAHRDRVSNAGDVDCASVPKAERHKSIQGNITNGSECRIDFYPSAGCGGRSAFSLTQYTNKCLPIDDFTSPLAFYRATGCEGA